MSTLRRNTEEPVMRDRLRLIPSAAAALVAAAVAISPVALAVSPSYADVRTDTTPTPSSSAMPMDHGDMPGMNHGDMPRMNHGGPVSRPRGLVLGGFAAVNGAAMAGAAALRKRTRGKPTGRRAAAQRRKQRASSLNAAQAREAQR